MNNDAVKYKYRVSGFIFQTMFSYYYLISSLIDGKWANFKNQFFRIFIYLGVLLCESDYVLWEDLVLFLVIICSIVFYKVLVEKEIIEFCAIKMRELQRRLRCTMEVLS